jgi:hypothetical protein
VEISSERVGIDV